MILYFTEFSKNNQLTLYCSNLIFLLLKFDSQKRYFCIKQMKYMENKDFIKRFASELIIEEMPNGQNRYSSLMMALKDAQKLTGRDEITGEQEHDFLENELSFLDPNSFICIVNYLIILDLIGEVFCKKKDNNLIKALSTFGDKISVEDKYAIAALRNSFAHNYGLININKYHKHKFTLDFSANTLLEKHPTKEWNGDFQFKSEETSTVIYVKSLIQLIENIWKKLNSEIDEAKVDSVLEINELKARFTVLR